jgi:predicted protein tyrosine phosphatase
MREQVSWVHGPWPGRLAIVARPRGGDWLEAEAGSWARSGLDIIVSLLTAEEAAEFGLAEEAAFGRLNGIEFLNFPIPDRGVPVSRGDTLKLVKELVAYLAAGKNVGIHCRQGIGRSGLIGACLLISLGMTPQVAFQAFSAARGCPVPETTEQRQWVEAFAPQLAAAAAKAGP